MCMLLSENFQPCAVQHFLYVFSLLVSVLTFNTYLGHNSILCAKSLKEEVKYLTYIITSKMLVID